MSAHGACEAVLAGADQPRPWREGLRERPHSRRPRSVRYARNVSAFNACAGDGALKIDMRATPLLWFFIFCFFEILYR
jgi:hypothetical protein